MPGREIAPESGQWVRVEGMSQPGVVTKVHAARRMADVQVGSLNWKLPWNRLQPTEPPEPSKKEKDSIQFRAAPGAVEHELDLHGLRVHEALEVLDKFLDTAVTQHLGMVKIIHGHGSGKVRKAVRDFLTGHHHVREFHFGDPAQGGLAVTVAHLKEP